MCLDCGRKREHPNETHTLNLNHSMWAEHEQTDFGQIAKWLFSKAFIICLASISVRYHLHHEPEACPSMDPGWIFCIHFLSEWMRFEWSGMQSQFSAEQKWEEQPGVWLRVGEYRSVVCEQLREQGTEIFTVPLCSYALIRTSWLY